MALNVFLSGIGVFLKLLCGLAINKVLSTQLGPAAFGVWGNIFSLTTLYTSFANGGISSGLIAKLSAPGQAQARRSRWLRAGLVFAVVVPVAITIFHSFGRHYEYVAGIEFLGPVVVLVLALCAAIGLQIQASALSEGKSRLNSVILGLSGPLSLAAYYFIVKPASVQSAVWGLLASTGIVTTLWLVGAGLRSVQWRPRRDPPAKPEAGDAIPDTGAAIRTLAPYVAIAIAPALLGTASIIAVRETIHIQISLEAAGLWQGMFRISDAVTAVAQAAVAYVLLPAVFGNISPRAAFTGYIKVYIAFVIGASCVGMLVLSLFSRDIVLLLYSAQFVEIAPILWIQFAGDTLKIMAMPFVAFFIYQRSLRISWGLEALFSGSFFASCYLLVQSGALAGAAWAYVFANLLLLLSAVFLFWSKRDA